ncbi:kinesin-like protein KIF16B isoform X2 [Daphnia magna]|uniref:kinesin-like protein KIF16B isoform X2 n=1 Tax=Daphnia magna TaxID=35525 RepID=UPI001E1BC053|nr:kinesin-like protein KIF16B isoform X2 [Daphnia magna]
MSNIKVAIRVRPRTISEATLDHQLTVHMGGNNIVHLHNPTISKTSAKYGWNDKRASSQPRQFAFDYCFPATDGSCASANIASQEKVFEDLGMPVLNSLFDGYNACVLAYGQSGTGKTYTMMGTPLEPGLAPKLCTAIFERITSECGCSNVHRPSFRIEISFMEIYNEKVRDLLEEYSNRGSVQLKIREHPQLGPYVQGLSRHTVEDAAAALGLLKEGVERRSSAATQKNGHSSRSHAVFTVHCTAAWVTGEGLPRETVAKLHLVDLAGSERASCNPVSRLRLKEGALINKSLASLGNVINALAEKASLSKGSISTLNTSSSSTSSINIPSVQTTPSATPRRSQTPFIPYRDSVLTWLLKDSLGGNSKTFLVAAISPSTRAFKETLNTLRFAERAKRVVNEPVINENASVELIHHLTQEVTRLRALFAQSVESNQSNDNSSLIPSENITKLLGANHSKACELTEDWLRKWRRGIGEAISTVHSTPQSTEIGIQTSFPIIMKDLGNVIPAKESKSANRAPVENATSNLGTIDFHSETSCWSDDSLDGSYPTEFRPTTDSHTEYPGMSKLMVQESASIIKPNFHIGESLSAPFSGSFHQQRPSPTPSSKKRISARRVIKTGPDVRTMFKNSGEIQQSRCSSPLSPSLVVTGRPPESFSKRKAFKYIPDQVHPFGISACSQKLPLDNLPSNQDHEIAKVKSNSYDEKMINNDSHKSYQELELASRSVEFVPSSRIGLSSCNSKVNCCCHILHHGSPCKLQHQNFLAQIGYQRNSYCQHDISYQQSRAVPCKSQSFDTILRAELLAIRRRMVARTASPKVAASLRYLTQWQTDSLENPLSIKS